MKHFGNNHRRAAAVASVKNGDQISKLPSRLVRQDMSKNTGGHLASGSASSLIPLTVALALFCALAGVLLVLSASAQAETCPNEQLRAENHSTSLPDCRAYEMVTPPFKFGESPTTDGSDVAPDGSALSYSSIGAFNEAGNDATAAAGEYDAIRLPSGWVSNPINPSAAQFQGGSPDREGASHESLDYSANLTDSLFLQTPIGFKPIDSRFYLHNVANGSDSEVGPMLPPEAVAEWTPANAEVSDEPRTGYVGASGNLSTIFFSQAGASETGLNYFWPGDSTTQVRGVQSLYEYLGTGNSEPELVAVSNQTSLADAARQQGKRHINEAADLISQCGAHLGGTEDGVSSDSYNAIAAEGQTVFFTPNPACHTETGKIGSGPAVTEVYARIDRDHTVDISEPTAAECQSCNEAEPANALFQAASQDGERVFFCTTQQLFSGTRGEAGTNLYEYAFNAPAGEKVTLVAPDLAPSEENGGFVRSSEDGGRVYFVSENSTLANNPDADGAAAQPNADNLYTYNAASRTIIFVAELSEADSQLWNATDEKRNAELTPDGRFLLFPSVNDLTPDASGSLRQLYRYEAPTISDPEGSLIRITVGADGFNQDGNISPPSPTFSPRYQRRSTPTFAGSVAVAGKGVALSSDGSRVFFSSPLALTPAALNNDCARELENECKVAALNIYEWRNGEVSLLSDGRDTHSSFGSSSTFLIGADPSGSDVYFTSNSALVPQDTDTQVDIYDAREDGGFQTPPSSSSCQGEACQGLLSAPPVFGVPSSTTFAGGSSGAVSTTTVKLKAKFLTRNQNLAGALRICKAKRNKERAACEAQARRKYGPKVKAKSKRSIQRSK
jgi:hypothetical protein